MSTTRLDVINSMLAASGITPLTVENDKHPLYLKALQVFESVRKEVQDFGLWFNTEVRELQPQTNGEILVPAGCIKADPVDRNHNLVLRGSRLYNRDEGTYDIGDVIRVKMYFDLPLGDVPFAAVNYIQSKATYDFYVNENGTGAKLTALREERDRTWTLLYREHIRSVQGSIYDNPNSPVNRLRTGRPPRYTGNRGIIRGLF